MSEQPTIPTQEQIVQFRLDKVAEAIGLDDRFEITDGNLPVPLEGVGIAIENRHTMSKMRGILREAGVHSTADLHNFPVKVLIVEKADYPEVTSAFVEKALDKIEALSKPTEEQSVAIQRLSRISTAFGLEPFTFDPGEDGVYGPGASMVIRGPLSKAEDLQITLSAAGLPWATTMHVGSGLPFLSVDAKDLPKIDEPLVRRAMQATLSV